MNDLVYMVHAFTSDVFELSLVSAIDENSVLEGFHETRARSFQGIAVILLVGGALISALMALNYSPIRRFFSLTERVFHRELDARHPLEDGADQTMRLSEVPAEQESTRTEAAAASLLRCETPSRRDGGLPESSDQIASWLRHEKSEFVVVVVEVATNPVAVRTSTRIAALEFEDEWRGLAKTGIDGRRVVVVYRRSRIGVSAPDVRRELGVRGSGGALAVRAHRHRRDRRSGSRRR